MGFHPIDLAAWNRREHFHHYLHQVPCFYSMTVDLDVTQLKKRGGPFYPAMLHSLATVVNRRQEFRMALDENGSPGSFDQLSPSYTVFHPKTETFSCLWTEYTPDYALFLRRYEEDMRLYGEVEAFEAKPNTPAASFNVSMIPWQSFSSFHLELPRGEDYLPPVHRPAGKLSIPNNTRPAFSRAGRFSVLPCATVSTPAALWRSSRLWFLVREPWNRLW